VKQQIQSELPPVRADLARAKEVLVQLLDNANLYSEKGKHIVVSAESNGNSVMISVADQGRELTHWSKG